MLSVIIVSSFLTRMWADAQGDGRPAEYRKFRNSIPCSLPCRKVWLTPTAGVPYSNAANIGERKT